MTAVIVKRRGILIWLLIVSLFSPMAVAGFNVMYTGSVQHAGEARINRVQLAADERIRADQVRDNKQWCDLLGALDAPPSPELTDAQRRRVQQYRALFHQLRIGKGCITK
jgi:hypothetical protein